jgi:hypothetical protein
MKERIVRYCNECGYELRETNALTAVSYFSSECDCPVCYSSSCLHLMWVDRRNVYNKGEKEC